MYNWDCLDRAVANIYRKQTANHQIYRLELDIKARMEVDIDRTFLSEFLPLQLLINLNLLGGIDRKSLDLVMPVTCWKDRESQHYTLYLKYNCPKSPKVCQFVLSVAKDLMPSRGIAQTVELLHFLAILITTPR